MTTKTLSEGTRERTEKEARGIPKPPQARKPMSERSRAANREWYPGLCTTCVNEPVCTFPRSADQPILTCDEFEGAVDVKPPRAVESPRFDDRFAVANREWFPGLCMTCEKRETCTFPKPEGGVFSCDEFE
jgi:hypothetical protein